MSTNDSAFFATNGRLHGEPSDTPRTDALVTRHSQTLAGADRIGETRELARELERENARLRAALENVVATLSLRVPDGDVGERAAVYAQRIHAALHHCIGALSG